MSKEVKLNERQQEAVDWDQGPLLVIAGPGTGKTQLLSQRVARILAETDAGPETILCLTYTESGVESMRARLLSTIKAEAYRVNISTYHAFGTMILEAYQNYSEHFTRRMDAPVDAVTQYKILRKIQLKLAPNDILRGDRISDMANTIAGTKGARLTPDDLRKVVRRNRADTEKINTALAPVMAKFKKGMRYAAALPIYQEMLEVLATFYDPQEIVPRVEVLANGMIASLNALIDAEEEKARAFAAKEPGAVSPKTEKLNAWRDRVFCLNEAGEYVLANRVATLKLESFANVLESYEAAMAEAGLYDFADMIEEAIRVLKEDQGFRLTMSERFQHILLDEFQDTNPSQFELIKLLCDYDQPDVMAVGDDDQAICEFQGAKASNLNDFAEHFKAHPVILQTNYRSYAEIVDTAKRVSEQIEDSFSRRQQIEKPLAAAKGAGGNIIERHEFVSSEAEYPWVVAQIAKLVDSGVPQKEIAVIMPRHKRIAPILAHFQKYPQLKVSYERRENLFDDPKISELIKLAAYVQGLANGRASAYSLVEILNFRFWGLSNLELLQATARARGDSRQLLQQMLESGNDKFIALANFLVALARESQTAPLELMIDYMLGATELEGFCSPFLQFYACDAKSYESFALYEKLTALREALRAYSKQDVARLGDMIAFCEDYSAAGEQLINASPYREAADAVQVMTVHHSKGMEFDYVFLMSADNVAWGSSAPNNDWMKLPANVMQIRHTGASADERKRLLFVAMTRARAHLYISNAQRNFGGRSLPRLEYLGEYEENGQIVSPYLPEASQLVKQHAENLDEAVADTDLAADWAAAYLQPQPDLKECLVAKMQGYRLSATDLTSFVDVVYAGPLEFYRSRVLGARAEALTPALQYGNLMHAAFERITREGISDEEALALFKAEAASSALAEDDREALLKKGEWALPLAFKKFAGVLRSPYGKAEVNFGPEHLSYAGVPISGKLDHIEVNPEAKTVEIYDFKTGKYYDKDWSKEPALLKYSLQLAFYKCLVEAAPEYRDYKVSKAHILFVNPDAEGELYDKEYDYELMQEPMEKLIPAIYRQITSLDFLFDEDLALEPNPRATVKTLRDFIKLLIEKDAAANSGELLAK